jgi:outer membrane lipoprotein-sorting protein
LLSGNFLREQRSSTSRPAGDSGGLQWFQLVPKHADTDFQLVRIGFDKGELRSMFLADKLNQITQLSFTQRRNATPSLPPTCSRFTPPPGVDVIGRGEVRAAGRRHLSTAGRPAAAAVAR